MVPSSLSAAVAGLVGLALAGGAGGAFAQDPPPSRALLIHGGRILCLDTERSEPEALLAVDGRVEALGSLAELRAAAEDRGLELTDLDLGGAVALPGLVDASVRMGDFGAVEGRVDLRGARDLEEIAARAAVIAEQTPRGRWVEGWGLAPGLLGLEESPVLDALSEALPRHPVALESADGRALVVNAEVLERAGLDGVVHEGRFADGRTPVDAEGRLCGVLIDGAARRVRALLPERKLAEREARLLGAQDALLERGVAVVHDLGTSFEDFLVLAALERKGLLKLRVFAYVGLDEPGSERRLDELGVIPGGDGRLVLQGVHLRFDGALAWRGAALDAPYADRAAGRGHLTVEPVRLTDLLRRATRRGLQVAVEVQGDRAVHLALDALESVGFVQPELLELRPRLEALHVVSLRDWRRFPELGVIPGTRPGLLLADLERAAAALGHERSEQARAWCVLVPEIGDFLYGSGFPAGDPDPIAGLVAARELLDWSLEQVGVPGSLEVAHAALAGRTAGPAGGGERGGFRGRLRPGAPADLSVLDIDPLAATSDELRRARVLATVVGGEVVWRAVER